MVGVFYTSSNISGSIYKEERQQNGFKLLWFWDSNLTNNTQWRLSVLLNNSDYNVHTDELKSIVLLLDDRLVEDDGVDDALLTGLCDGTFVCTWSGVSFAVGEWIGSNDVRTGLVSVFACISFSIAVDKKFSVTNEYNEDTFSICELKWKPQKQTLIMALRIQVFNAMDTV